MMSTKTWKLIDVAAGVYVDEINITPENVGGPAGDYSVTKHTLRGGLSNGVDVVRVANGAFSLVVLPTRGMGVWKAWLGHKEIGWRSPVAGPVHPKFVPIAEPSGLGWLDGFDELLARCGLESNGAPDFDDAGRLAHPLHGRIQNRPAHRVDVAIDGQTGEITVTGVVDETRFLFSKLRMTSTIKTRVGEPGFWIRDEIENLAATEASMQMLYHVNFGEPLLESGSRLIAPVKTLVPRDARAAEGIGAWSEYAAEEPGFQEQVYFFELAADDAGRTQAMLQNAAGDEAVSLYFNKRQLPCFTLWKNTAAAADGFVTGLEPGTNFPNPRSFESEQGRVVKMPPGGKFVIDVGLEAHAGAAAVEQARQAIAALSGGAEPRAYDKPQKGWCAG